MGSLLPLIIVLIFNTNLAEQGSSLGEKTGKNHRKNGLLNLGLKIGSFLTKSFLIFGFSDLTLNKINGEFPLKYPLTRKILLPELKQLVYICHQVQNLLRNRLGCQISLLGV